MENKLPNLELLGDRVIILLDKAEDHTVTESGLIIPLFENAESDGGKPISKLSLKRYLSVGTVLALSATAQEKLPTINVGDRVYVTPSSASPNYQFLPDRSQLVEDWTGMISVSHILIEAKIKEQ
jgi:co-chaperonin GroES (HSP10)